MQFINTVISFLRKRLTFKYDIVAPITATVLVLISGSFIVFLIAQNQSSSNRDSENSFLEQQQQLITDHITQRIAAYEQTLISGSSLITISGNISHSQWSTYISRLNIEDRFPGTDSIGYIELVPDHQRREFIRHMRMEGFDNYAIHPTEDSEVYFPTTYLASTTESSVDSLGFDHYSQKILRNIMQIARDSGQLALTPPISINQNDQKVIVAYYPIYSEAELNDTAERRQNLQGYTYVLLNMHSFGDRIKSQREDEYRYGFRLTDVTADQSEVLYSSNNFEEIYQKENGNTSDRSLSVLGRQWNLELVLDSDHFGSTMINPILVFTIGMLVNATAAGFLFMLLIHRQARLELSHETEIQKAKDDLLALASHQLRTPATGVKQYVGMVLAGYAGKISKEQENMLEKANDSNERQLEIINQLLYVAKADAGQLKVEPVRFDMVELARDIVQEQTGPAHEKNLRVTLRSKKPVYVYADQAHIRMIIENLVSNAIKYSYKRGKIEVYFSNWRGRAAIHVSDVGVGIHYQDMDLLFKKFSRIDNKLTKSVGGSGIGLFLSQQLANAHDGEIIVESEPEKGSTFTLNIPKKYKK